MENHFDKVAKLLATENLKVQRGVVRTASFDVKDRVLTLPQWKDMTPELETMLIGHEVGHALFTDISMLEVSKDRPALHSYVNVVEDARIERMMKEKFPGLRKDFIKGYGQLIDRDFFGLEGTDIKKLKLIDRINLYFKVGIKSGVQFTPEERVFVIRAEKVKTPEEVVALAEDILEFAKAQKEKQDEEMRQMDELYANEDAESEWDEVDEDADDFDSDFADEDGEESDEEGGNAPSNSEFNEESDQKMDTDSFTKSAGETGENPEDQLMSDTQSKMNDSLDELADTSTKYVDWTMMYDWCDEIIVSPKEILEDSADYKESYRYVPSQEDEFRTFMSDSNRAVNYLVKEFEMKKSAQDYKRTTTAKSGSLDMGKLWSYTLNDDLFKRMNIVRDGKNHGMIFLLDWSGSMYDEMQDTIKQLIPLAQFCRRVQIPFKVMAFSSEYRKRNRRDDIDGVPYYERDYNAEKEAREKGFIPVRNYRFRLLEFMNDKMSNTDFTEMAKRLYLRLWDTSHSFGLGGTPLNDALYYMVKFVPEFKKANNIEKLSLITLTDGAGHEFADFYRRERDEEGNTFLLKHFIVDEKTGKKYHVTGSGEQQTQALLKIIKDRSDVATIGFHVCPNRKYDLRSAYYCAVGGSVEWHNTERGVTEMRQQFRKNGFGIIDGTARDLMVVIPTHKLTVVEEQIDVTSKMTSRQIANKFGKTLKKNRQNRVLLDHFVAKVA